MTPHPTRPGYVAVSDCPVLNAFLLGLHHSTQVLSLGQATVLGHTVPAVMLRNLYGQRLVWGAFSCERGKFKGRLSSSAATEDVLYTPEMYA